MPKYFDREFVCPRAVKAFALPVVCTLLTACGGGGGSKPPAPATLQAIAVTAPGQTLAAGLQQQYSANGTYSDGTSKAITGATWTTSDATVATVNSSGLVTAVKQGAATISAASGSITGSATLTVQAPNLLSIAVSPLSATVVAGQTQQFMASGSYSDGSMQSVNNVSWSSGTAGVATINSSGLATAVAAGTSTIMATSGSVSGTASLTVTPNVSAIGYQMGQTLTAGVAQPEGVVVSDFNGDGKLDIAISNLATSSVSVFLNDGTGNFGTPIVTSVPNGSMNVGALAVGDFNEDGKSDLVVATIGGPQVAIVLLGNGDGTFQQQAPIPNSFGFFAAQVVDLNGDKHQDLVMAGNGTMFVALGNGDGTFQSAVGLPSPSSPGSFHAVTLADFNGDGKLDIAAPDLGDPNAGVGTLDFWPGNGDGTFGTPTAVNLFGSAPNGIASGDFNNDGKQDLLIGSPDIVVIAFGNGDGTFNLSFSSLLPIYSGNSNSVSDGLGALATSLTNNGKIDAVTTDYLVGTLQITFNDALGNFPPAPGVFPFSLGAGINQMAVGDLNGDGVQDVVVTNYLTNQVTTILSGPAAGTQEKGGAQQRAAAEHSLHKVLSGKSTVWIEE